MRFNLNQLGYWILLVKNLKGRTSAINDAKCCASGYILDVKRIQSEECPPVQKPSF